MLTAEIVFFEPTISNEIVFLAGDTVSYGDVADRLEVALGRSFSRSEWTVPFLMVELARDPRNMIRKYRAAFAMGRGVTWNKDGTFSQQNGIPVTDIASSLIRSQTRSQARSLASKAHLNIARSHTLLATFSCCRMAQMCFGLSGALGPIRRPAFHGRLGWMNRSGSPPCRLPFYSLSSSSALSAVTVLRA